MNGQTLKHRREALGMSQSQLAEALSVAANTVARWERDERAIPPFLGLALETIERNISAPKAKKPPRATRAKSKRKA
jgi:transcriptional regulator with XRE-family HTH domain